MTKKKSARTEEYARRSRKNRKGVKSFEMIPDGVQPMAIGKRSVDVSAKVRARIREDAQGLAAKITPFEWKFLLEVIYGPHGCVRYKAMKKLRPYLSDLSARQVASRTWSAIKGAIGEDGIQEVIGLTVEKVDTTIVGGLDAEFTREFITRDGRIVQGPTRPDRSVQMQAVALAMKRLGLSKEKEPGGSVLTVNVTSYLAGPVAEQKPWPGGGRTDADGVFRPTVGPGSLAALKARGALPASQVTVDLGDRKTERDD